MINKLNDKDIIENWDKLDLRILKTHQLTLLFRKIDIYRKETFETKDDKDKKRKMNQYNMIIDLRKKRQEERKRRKK